MKSGIHLRFDINEYYISTFETAVKEFKSWLDITHNLGAGKKLTHSHTVTVKPVFEKHYGAISKISYEKDPVIRKTLAEKAFERAVYRAKAFRNVVTAMPKTAHAQLPESANSPTSRHVFTEIGKGIEDTALIKELATKAIKGEAGSLTIGKR